MKVPAVQVSAVGCVEIVEREIPAPEGAEVLIRVTQAAICTSDVDRYRGHDPHLPNPTGHEIAGEVIDVGARVTRFHTGDLVTAWTPAGGAMAELYLAEARHCCPVSPDVSFPAAAEPLGCVVNTVRYAQPQVGDVVSIAGGTGFMGLMLVQMSRLAGAKRIIVSGRRQHGLRRALELGATDVVNTDADDLEAVVDEITGGHGVDVSYELTGTAAGVNLAARVAHPGSRGRPDTPSDGGGALVIAGFHQGGQRDIDLGHWNEAGLRTINAHFPTDWQCVQGMGRAVQLLETGTIDPGPYITFPLQHVTHAFETAARRDPGFYKAVITFE